MNRVDFSIQQPAADAAFRGGCDANGRGQEPGTEEQGANMNFSQLPGVPAIAGWEERFPKKHAPIFLLLLACVAVLPRLAAQDARTAPAKTVMFWKASSGTNNVYLLGSIKVGPKDCYPLPGEVEEAFESSAVLVVETGVSHPQGKDHDTFPG